MKASWNGHTIAESDDIVMLENNAYFPAGSVNPANLRPSAHTSTCPWKGIAHYHSIAVGGAVGGAVNTDAAWFYPDPKPQAARIKDRVAFWKGVKVTG